MARYYVLTEAQIERLAEAIKTAILKTMKPLNLPDDQTEPHKARNQGLKYGRGGRKRLSQIIYETMGEAPFTAKEAFDAISGKYEFRGDRGLDSVRTALRTDEPRFRKLDDGQYQKVLF